MYFPSKRDLWLGLLIWGLMLLGAVPALLKPGKGQLILMVAVILFIGWIWFGTGYEISDDELKIQGLTEYIRLRSAHIFHPKCFGVYAWFLNRNGSSLPA